MNKHFSKALSMILCLLMIFAQFPVPAHAHEHDHAHGGLVLSVDDGAVTLTHDETELAHWPLSEGLTPSLAIGTVDGSFALLMQLDEPQLVLFKAFTPDALTLCGAFDRVAVDSTLETALTLCADEHSSMAHAELLGAVTLENAGTVEKLSAVETAVVTGGNLPENSLTAEDSAEIAEAAAKDFLAEAAKAVELHQASNDKEHVIIIDASADEEISVRSAEPSELPKLPVEEKDDEEKEADAPTRLPCGHMSDANGNHSKLACDHYACADGNHSKLACGHYACAGGNHNKLNCGHFACASGDHAAASCGAVGHYKCDSKTHETPDCGTDGHCVSDGKDHSYLKRCYYQTNGRLTHYACDGKQHVLCVSCLGMTCDYAGDPADHTTDMACGHRKCSYIEDHDAAACGADGHYNCDGLTHETPDCGTAGHCISDDKDHSFNDGCDHQSGGTLVHYACDGKVHEWCDSCNDLKCAYDGDPADHTTPLSCGQHMKCSKIADHNAAACGADGHYNCDGETHETPACGTNGHCFSDWKVHNMIGSCNEISLGALTHYVCDGQDHGLCRSCYRLKCDYDGDPADHTTPLSCGQHMKCSGIADHNAAACGADGHYNCDGLTHETPDCGTAGHCISDDKDHSFNDGCDHQSGGTLVHYACDGKVHEWCDSCNDLKCAYDGDPADHTTPLSCGQHMKCSEIADHTAAACNTSGHYNCDGKTHTAAVCSTAGHTNCDETDHSKLVCGHYTCEAGDHTAASCGTSGHFKCDNLDHRQALCGIGGHYSCDGNDHGNACDACSSLSCIGNHAYCGDCEEFFCNGRDHSPADCGTYGHTECDSLVHDVCSGCGGRSCDGGLHYNSCSGCYEQLCHGDHTKLPCNHYACENGHALADCGKHCTCSGTHEKCSFCDNYVCNGSDHTHNTKSLAPKAANLTPGINDANTDNTNLGDAPSNDTPADDAKSDGAADNDENPGDAPTDNTIPGDAPSNDTPTDDAKPDGAANNDETPGDANPKDLNALPPKSEGQETEDVNPDEPDPEDPSQA